MMKGAIVSLLCLLPLDASAGAGLMNIRATAVPGLVGDYFSEGVAVVGLGPNAKMCFAQGQGRLGRIVDSHADDNNPVTLLAAQDEAEISLARYLDERAESVDYAGMMGIALTLAIRNVNTALIRRDYRDQDHRLDSYTVRFKVPTVPNCR